MQHSQVVAYGSTQLKSHEWNYSTHDLELAAIVFTLTIQCHYLYGQTFKIYTNHKSLKYFFFQRELNMRERCWMDLLEDYNCKILYQLGNIVANAPTKRNSSLLAQMMVSNWRMFETIRRLQLNHYSEGVYLVQTNLVSSKFLIMKPSYFEIDYGCLMIPSSGWMF